MGMITYTCVGQSLHSSDHLASFVHYTTHIGLSTSTLILPVLRTRRDTPSPSSDMRRPWSNTPGSPPLTRKRARDARTASHGSSTTTDVPPVQVISDDEDVVEVPVQTREDLDKQLANDAWAKVELALMHKLEADDLGDGLEPANWLATYITVCEIFRLPFAKNAVKLEFYEEARRFIARYVDHQVSKLVTLERAELIEDYAHLWQMSQKFICYMNRMFFKMHKYWIPVHATPLGDTADDLITTVENLFLIYWKQQLHEKLENLTDHIIDLIEDDRRGIAIDAESVRVTLDSFLAIGSLETESRTLTRQSKNPGLKFYVEVFENPFLFRTANFYDCIAKNYARSPDDDPVTHIKAIGKMFEDEEVRLRRLVINRTREPTRIVLEKKLVGNHIDLYHRYAHRLITSPVTTIDAHLSLRTIVGLLSRIEGGLEPVRSTFRDCIIREGTEIIESKFPTMADSSISSFHNYLPLLESLYGLYDRCAKMVDRAFDNMNMFVMALEYGLQNVLNQVIDPCSYPLPMILAHYVNHVLTGEVLEDIPVTITGGYYGFVIETVEAEGRVNSRDRNARPAKRPRCQTRNPDPLLPQQGNSSNGSPILRRSARLQKKAVKKAPRTLKKQGDASGIGMRVFLHPDVLNWETMPSAMRDDTMPRRRRDFILGVHLNRCVQLLTFVADKQMFIDICRSLMAERLKDCYVERLEARFINKVQNLMGAQFTSKLSGMLNDLGQIKATQKLFEEKMATKNPAVTRSSRNTALKVAAKSRISVRHSLHWPNYRPDNMKIPKILSSVECIFEDFYKQNFKKRKLTWLRSQGSVELLFRHRGKTYTLTTTVPQACVLLQFNDDDQMSLTKLANACGMKTKQLEGHLLGLTNRGSHSLLRKCEEDDDAEMIIELDENVDEMDDCGTESDFDFDESASNTKYEFNSKFSWPFNEYKAHVGEVVTAFSEPVAQTSTSLVERAVQIDAAVVRVLKTHKRLPEVDLINKVVESLGRFFVPSNKDIQTQIESLIDREFISSQDDVYLYDMI